MQVLDDSTDRVTRDLVDDKVLEWRERGVDCEVVRRTNRAGYKAGALKEVRRAGNAVALPHFRRSVKVPACCPGSAAAAALDGAALQQPAVSSLAVLHSPVLSQVHAHACRGWRGCHSLIMWASLMLTSSLTQTSW